MVRKGFRPEQIINKLRAAEVLLSQGATVGEASRKLGVSDQLFDLLVLRGIPEHIRSDNGPEFTAGKVRGWLNHLGVKTLFIEPGSPWENGYIQSFNGKLRDELLNTEIFTTLTEAKTLVADWRKEYSQFRPHSSLHYKPPAPEMFANPTLSVVTLLGAGQKCTSSAWTWIKEVKRWLGHLRVSGSWIGQYSSRGRWQV